MSYVCRGCARQILGTIFSSSGGPWKHGTQARPCGPVSWIDAADLERQKRSGAVRGEDASVDTSSPSAHAKR